MWPTPVVVFGAMGGSDDTPIAAAYAWARAFRVGDGTNEVHLRQSYRMEEAPEFAVAESPHILPTPCFFQMAVVDSSFRVQGNKQLALLRQPG